MIGRDSWIGGSGGVHERIGGYQAAPEARLRVREAMVQLPVGPLESLRLQYRYATDRMPGEVVNHMVVRWHAGRTMQRGPAFHVFGVRRT